MNIRNEAYDIIVKVLKHKEYSDNLLQQRAKKLRHQTEQIAFMYNLVKGTIKYQLKLDYICRQYTETAKFDKTDIKIKVLLYMGLYQLLYMNSVPDHAAINETVELAKTQMGTSVSGFVNSILRSFQRNPDVILPDDHIQRIAFEYSYPLELIKVWHKLWGTDYTEKLAVFFNETPQLHIRVNIIATESDKLIQYFQKREIKCIQSTASRNILVTDNAFEALDDVAFSEGYYSIQDTSAALIVELLDPHPGESVLDLFAAPGGKCTYIAERLHNSGEVIAVDKTPHKMKLLKQAAERLQLTNIKLLVQDAFTYGPVAPAYNMAIASGYSKLIEATGKSTELRRKFRQTRWISGLFHLHHESTGK
jgi:16S rRNA (cytosine967-C5)-methyltransferase